jgi:hypothetical protein
MAPLGHAERYIKRCLSLTVRTTSLLRLFPSWHTCNLLCKQLGRAASSPLSQASTTPTNPKNAHLTLLPSFAGAPASG